LIPYVIILSSRIDRGTYDDWSAWRAEAWPGGERLACWTDGKWSTGDGGGGGWTSSTTVSRDVEEETTDKGEQRRSGDDIHAGALRCPSLAPTCRVTKTSDLGDRHFIVRSLYKNLY